MAEPLEIGDRLLVVYDGHCGLCNGWVRWLLRRDRRGRLRFVASQSEKAAGLLARHAEAFEHDGTPGTVLVFRTPLDQQAQPLTRFAAMLAVLHELPRPWPAVAAALGWIPAFLSDPVYRLVARWRYRIWGRLESCPLPTDEERGRFL